ncbi:hypothetical protein EG329_007204 [Mollisiaceae sp. DMI_Dod_QoI]|nr:hypothetical protein EG329_007204 [Helotiales sp. DMI_Dod_QoI]
MLACAYQHKYWKEELTELLGGSNLLVDFHDLSICKFIDDFVTPIEVLATESVFWNGRKAWAPLPWISVDDDDQIDYPDGEFERQSADARYCSFLDTRPDYSKVIILIRGIDGASIDPASWLFLQQRYPKLRITLAFSCTEWFVRFRVPDNENYFSRTDPYDNRLYGFFYLDELVRCILRQAQDAKYRWLMNEWRLGKLYREALSMAYQQGGEDEISNANSQFHGLFTAGRNDLPDIPDR